MEALLNRIAQLQPIAKVGILAGAVLLLGLGYHQLFYTDLVDEQKQQEEVLTKAHTELGQYQKRRDQRKAYLNEVSQLRDEQRELLRMLPHSDDIEQFIESMNAQVEAAGLTKVASVRETAVPEEIYIRIPIRMSVVGNYHQINRFFKSVADLQRIVTIGDLSLQPSEARPSTSSGHLKAEFIAQTFQLLEPSKAPAKPTTPGTPAAAPAAGGGK
jgi:type IV pilus assembly protein PilO